MEDLLLVSLKEGARHGEKDGDTHACATERWRIYRMVRRSNGCWRLTDEGAETITHALTARIVGLLVCWLLVAVDLN